MADSTVANLTAASTLDGTELYYTVQGGADRKATGAQIKTLVSASPTLVTPNLGTPSAGTLTSCTGLPVSTGISGLGSSVATALGVNVGSAGAVVVNGGALGTPSSGTLTNATGLPILTGVSGLGTTVATALGNAINTASGVVALDSSGNANFAAQVVNTPQTLTDASTIAWNCNSGAIATVTLGATGRTLTPSNLKNGATYILYVKQDGTGSRTITTWTNFKWPGGTAPTLSTAASAVDIITGVSDGTYIYAAAQLGFA